MGIEIKTNFSTTVALLPSLEHPAGKPGLNLSVGQEVVALVAGQEGDSYILQVGDRRLLAKSELPLETGEVIRLIVLGAKDQTVVLKRVPFWPAEKEENLASSIKQLLVRHGFVGEKGIGKLMDAMDRIPVEEKVGIRYLLDPHLVTVVLFAAGASEDVWQKIEVNRYKSRQSGADVFEVWLELNMSTLGRIEAALTQVDGSIAARIWAELPETETLLRERKDEIRAAISVIEIVPAIAGPILPKKQEINLDIKV